MKRKRTIRDFTKSAKVNSLTDVAECFFTRLMMKADDYGYFWGDPQILKAELYPTKTDSEKSAHDMRVYRDECVEKQLIKVYEAGGKEYIFIFEFGQRLRTMKSLFPRVDEDSVKANDRTGYVYLIGTSYENPVKLGFSANPWARVKDLNVGNHEEIKLLLTIKSSYSVERNLQKLLSPYQVKSEWFSLPIDIIKMLELCSDGDFEVNELLENILNNDENLRSNYVSASSSYKEGEQEEEDEREREVELYRKKIPEIEEFLEHCKVLLQDRFPAYEYSLRAKYQAWVDNKWKDGYNKPIKIWKTKIANTIPYLKPTPNATTRTDKYSEAAREAINRATKP